MPCGSCCGCCGPAVPEGLPGESAPRESVRRLFFALWPDEAMRQAMALATREAALASGSRPVPAGNLHVTLAFLGSVPARRVPQLGVIAHRAATPCDGSVTPPGNEPPIELVFEHLEHWRAAHLLCAVPSEPSARVVALVHRLQGLLTEGGFAPDLKSPFRPHVTLARKIYRSPRMRDMQRVAWRFTDFALLDSRTLPEGAVYTVLEKFSLSR